MVEDHLLFNQRVNRLSRKHRAMARGYRTQMRADGLIVMKPQRQLPTAPLRAILLFVFALLLFKAFLVSSLGPQSYGERLARLEQGTPVEQMGAWAMQIDPATQFLADQIGPILR